MASSRWKRFAFFDRHTLPLPTTVLDDVIPRSASLTDVSDGIRMSARRQGLRFNPDDDGTATLFPDEDSVGMGENFSLAVTTASLPVTSVRGLTKAGQQQQSAASSTTGKISVHGGGGTSNKPPASVPASTGGVAGMLSTITACTTSSLATTLSSDRMLPCVTTAGGGRDNVVSISPGGSFGVGGGGGGGVSATSASAATSSSGPFQTEGGESVSIDGLVLLFLSSRHSCLVHCVDVTVRCNPPPVVASTGSQHHPSGGGMTPARFSEEHLASESSAPVSPDDHHRGHSAPADLEDLDGWRGYFDPFARGVPEENISASKRNLRPAEERIIQEHLKKEERKARVVGLAVCTASGMGGSSSGGSGAPVHLAVITDMQGTVGVSVHVNPHLYLSSSLPPDGKAHGGPPPTTTAGVIYQPPQKFDFVHRGNPRTVDVTPGIVAVGTDTGLVIVYSYGTPPTRKTVAGSMVPPPSSGSGTVQRLQQLMEIPPPPSHGAAAGVEVGVSSLKLVITKPKDTGKVGRVKLYVCYRRRRTAGGQTSPQSSSSAAKDRSSSSTATVGGGGGGAGKGAGGGGVCCYDLGPVHPGTGAPGGGGTGGPSARYDLDGRDVPSSGLCDPVKVVGEGEEDVWHYMVARPDGLYTYSHTDKIGVSPIDGTKIAMCSVPPPPISKRRVGGFLKSRQGGAPSASESKEDGGEGATTGGAAAGGGGVAAGGAGASYALVATTDSKSGRDAVDVYDAMNKLVAFHVLLSPGHRALRAAGVTTLPAASPDGMTRGGRSSAIVLTSGGSIVTLTEKVTSDKVSLLVQKNLYSAAISMAYADPSYQAADITALYRRHAEHLYRKGDFAAAIEQYIYTIGSLEPSHVIFRYLDAPKIPLLAKYLEELRSKDMATPVHNELLRTCYLKLNDTVAAEKIAASSSTSMDASSCASIVSSLAHNPTDALATICSFEAPQAAEALVVHGATLARALPRETAGVVVSLCTGTYSPSALADAAAGSSKSSREGSVGGAEAVSSTATATATILEGSPSDEDRPKLCDQYPVHLFTSAFLENPKLLRLILAHCKRNKCVLSPSLRRTLLELTLEEWNNAKRTGDTVVEKLRHDEAMAALTDSHVEDIGDYEALVIVQLAGFSDGEVLLYERLQMAPMLLERYAEDGGERARRQMLAMCRSDPELLADVLGYFVGMAGEKIGQGGHADNDSDSEYEAGEIMDDIREALHMARAQGVLPPVRIARILAGEGVGQFSVDSRRQGVDDRRSVPLSVALDYVGAILDESSKEISRLKADVEEYNTLCNSMEAEIETLLVSSSPESSRSESKQSNVPNVNIEEMYSKLRETLEEGGVVESQTELAQEEFWREMGDSEDRFDTIARFFGKGLLL